jgi:phosphatidylglycerophosphate synthase
MSAFEWQIPGVPLRASVLRASAFGLLVVTGVAVAARPWLDLGVLYPGKAAAAFGAAMVMVFGFIGRHHPFERFGPANHVTMIRTVLVALVASLIGESAVPRAAEAASAAVGALIALDGVDGWLARRSRMASAFGARFDMETDAVLVLVLSVLVWQHQKAGPWVLLGGALRYGFVMAGWWLPWMARPLPPTRRARAITVCHLVGLGVALVPIVPAPIAALVVASTLGALSWSFAVDVRRLWRMAQREGCQDG